MKQFTWYDELTSIVKQAGNRLQSYVVRELERQEKTVGGTVTQADIEIEEFLKDQLHALMPEAGFIAEESGQSQTHQYMWVIDPIDGTNNFSRSIPYYCISVALTEHNRPIMGAIYEPITGRMFYAERQKGAFHNGQICKISDVSLKQAMIAVGLPYKGNLRDNLIRMAITIGHNAKAIRHFGAIALDLAHVAAADLDAAFFANLAWWDVAAGIILITEAGGKVTDFQGNELTPSYTTCVAGAPRLHEALLAVIDKGNS